MNPTNAFSRRTLLRGMLGGSLFSVGVPLLDCFLNESGTALANGSPLPLCFTSWFAGLGLNPGRWEPKTAGKDYEMGVELQMLQPFRDKINVYSGLKCFTDSHPNRVHLTGPEVALTGGISTGAKDLPSIDTILASTLGTRTRFRSLEVSTDGTGMSQSTQGGGIYSPAESSPEQLYMRLFGPEFRDPNSATFTPDPEFVARKSVLSIIGEQRKDLMPKLGSADRARMDQYFTSLRSLEQQLLLQLQKPAPIESCSVPAKVSTELPPNSLVIEDVRAAHKLHAAMLAHALACDQTHVVNFSMSVGASMLRRAGSGMTMHIYSHEEPVDPKVGYQVNLAWFMQQTLETFKDMLVALNDIREGDGTLLDRSLVLYSTDTGLARFHGLDNVPILTAGGANGRIKTGLHVKCNGDPITRVGLTVMQALGVPLSSWGTESNSTSKTITEVTA